MKRLLIPILFLLGCCISSCLSTPKQYTELESHVLDATDSQPIFIQVNHGEVIILKSEDGRVKVGGQVLFADGLEYRVSSAEKQILINADVRRSSLPDAPLRLEVRIPKDMPVKIETDSASVLVSNYRGDLEAASTSGNITIEQTTGRMTLRSNRGNIIVRESSGVVGAVGNYGALTMQNVSGETAASTIMGNIMFDGSIQMGDMVRLEADHGSISVNLKPDSALSLQVRSTSGDVACILPGVTSSTRTCDGEIGSGGGNLSIRTVSGAVTLQLIP